MKNTLRFFALLDVISIILLSRQVWYILGSQASAGYEPLQKLRIAIVLLMFLLLFFSAAGLFLLKKWGLVLSFIEFPLRVPVWAYSFGFLTLLTEYVPYNIFDWLFRLVIVLEFFRMYFTIQAYRSTSKPV